MKRYPRRSVGWGAVLMLSAVLCPPASRGDEEKVRRLFEGAIAATCAARVMKTPAEPALAPEGAT